MLTMATATWKPRLYFAEMTADASVQSIAFSAISDAQANKLLQDVHLAEVDGFKVAPLAQATGTSSWHSEYSQMSCVHAALLTLP